MTFEEYRSIRKERNKFRDIYDKTRDFVERSYYSGGIKALDKILENVEKDNPDYINLYNDYTVKYG